MPAAVAVPLISTAVSAGTSLLQTSAANRQAKKTQQAIDNYQRQDIVNPNLGLQVSTLGADRQREDLSRSIATMANQAAYGGSRAILGLAPNMLGQQMQQEEQIAGTLDQQEAQRQAAVAQGEGMVTQMTEQRENADLAGLGNQLNVARQERANGINNMLQTGFGAASLGLEMNNAGLFNGLFMKNYKPITQGSPSGFIAPSPKLNINPPNIPTNAPLLGANLFNPLGLPYLPNLLK